MRAIARAVSCQLSAVKIGWVLSVYHQFFHGTHHFLALLAIVKWLRPELFLDLAPEACLQELHDGSLPSATQLFSGNSYRLIIGVLPSGRAI